MFNNIGKIIILTGIAFLLYGITLFSLWTSPVKVGFLLNIIFYAFDSVWFVFSGIFLVYSGVTIHKGKDITNRLLCFSGHFLIFSIVFLCTSYIFNVLAKPHFQSTGRIFTFIIQALSRLFSPSLSFEFFIPLGGLILFIASSIWFQRAGIKMIHK